MSNKKITQLSSYSTPQSGDLFAIVDIANSETKKISFADIASTSWSTTGNSGTDSSTDFIGTTDEQDLVFRTNNQEAFRITSSGVFSTQNDIYGNYVRANFFHYDSNGMGFGNNGLFNAFWTNGNYIYGNATSESSPNGGYIGLAGTSGRIGISGDDVMTWDNSTFAIFRNLDISDYMITSDGMGFGYYGGTRGIFTGGNPIYGTDFAGGTSGPSIYLDYIGGSLRGAYGADELTFGNGSLGAVVPLGMGGNSISAVYDLTMSGAFSGAAHFSVFGASGSSQYAGSIGNAGFTANSGTTMNASSASTGGTGVGSAAYTFGDVVRALKTFGFLAGS